MMNPSAIIFVFSQYRRKRLTKMYSIYYDSGAFLRTSEGALFLPYDKDDQAPSFEGAFFVCISLYQKESNH